MELLVILKMQKEALQTYLFMLGWGTHFRKINIHLMYLNKDTL